MSSTLSNGRVFIDTEVSQPLEEEHPYGIKDGERTEMQGVEERGGVGLGRTGFTGWTGWSKRGGTGVSKGLKSWLN